MAIYEITQDRIRSIEETSFDRAGLTERGDLQHLLWAVFRQHLAAGAVPR